MGLLPRKVQEVCGLRPTLFLRSLTLFSLEASLNLLLWVVTLVVAAPSSSSNFASLALIAWSTGLRHGLDADHICAIDNATRRIVSSSRQPRGTQGPPCKSRLLFWRQGGQLPPSTPLPPAAPTIPPGAIQRPLLVGLWFSLGHSTVVIIVTIAIAISLQVANNLDGFGGVGSIIGPAVSGTFLFLVAVGNSIMLARAWRARRMKKKKEEETQANAQQAATATGTDVDPGQESETKFSSPPNDPSRFMGLLTRLALPLLKVVTRPHHMYVVGVLFGLGFDTASTIALLSVSASASLTNGGNAKVVLLAFLFTAGMTWVDCCDSILMVWAYAPPDEGQAGGKGMRRWWTLFEESRGDLPSYQGEEAPDDPSRDEANDCDPEKPRQVGSSSSSCLGEDCRGNNTKISSPPLQCKAEGAVMLNHSHDQQEGDISPGRGKAILSASIPPSIPLASLSSSAQSLSYALTLLSILLAFTISILVLMGLLASQCSSCSRSLQLHQHPQELVVPFKGEQGGGKRVVNNDGGLAGRWWNFWDQANENSGFIGAAIVACFLLLTVIWWVTVGVRRRRRDRSKVTETETANGLRQ